MSTDVGSEAVPTLEDLVERLGNIPLRRIVLDPPPGRATEKDLLRLMRKTGRLYELVEGTLVEKPMGYKEGSLAMWLGHLIQCFLDQNDLGNLAGADGTMRLMPHLVRIPDISFVNWEKLPGKVLPTKPIPDLAPDLAIEVLSEGNTPGEMKRKRKEYFFSGAGQVWLVDPEKRTVSVYTSPDEGFVLTEADTLTGGDVLPGFALPVKRIFDRLPKGPSGKPRKPRKK
jgi:Uma2 family endonuclease